MNPHAVALCGLYLTRREALRAAHANARLSPDRYRVAPVRRGGRIIYWAVTASRGPVRRGQ